MDLRDNSNSCGTATPCRFVSFRLPFFVFFFLLFALGTDPPSVFARDCWLSVHGAGRRDGTSRENAYAVSANKTEASAEQCWAETSPDGTMYVLEGRYSVEEGTFWKLKISGQHSGPANDPAIKKKLIGVGRVTIVGSRQVPYDPAWKESGETWIELREGARQLHIENFDVSRIQLGILADAGGYKDLSFKGLRFQDTRQNLVLYGHPECRDLQSCKGKNAESLSSRIRIENVHGMRYSKRHIRLTHGISDVTVLNSSADAQFLDGDFAVGFDVDNPSHDIEFRNCTARGNLFSGSDYWNGDGFKSESETENIRWVRCAAFDNADAGFDVKGPQALLEQVLASGNSRNIRIWSPRETLLDHVVSTHSRYFGGDGTPSGLWVQGMARCQACTIFANPVAIHLEKNEAPFCRLTLQDSWITADRQEKLLLREENTEIHEIRTQMRSSGFELEAKGIPENEGRASSAPL